MGHQSATVTSVEEASGRGGLCFLPLTFKFLLSTFHFMFCHDNIDFVIEKTLFSCVDLLREIQLRVKPKYHIFGHIHEGRGHNLTASQLVFFIS